MILKHLQSSFLRIAIDAYTSLDLCDSLKHVTPELNHYKSNVLSCWDLERPAAGKLGSATAWKDKKRQWSCDSINKGISRHCLQNSSREELGKWIWVNYKFSSIFCINRSRKLRILDVRQVKYFGHIEPYKGRTCLQTPAWLFTHWPLGDLTEILNKWFSSYI